MEGGFGYGDAFDQALRCSPRDARLRFRVGSHLWRMGDTSGLEVLREVIRLDPGLCAAGWRGCFFHNAPEEHRGQARGWQMRQYCFPQVGQAS